MIQQPVDSVVTRDKLNTEFGYFQNLNKYNCDSKDIQNQYFWIQVRSQKI